MKAPYESIFRQTDYVACNAWRTEKLLSDLNHVCTRLPTSTSNFRIGRQGFDKRTQMKIDDREKRILTFDVRSPCNPSPSTIVAVRVPCLCGRESACASFRLRRSQSLTAITSHLPVLFFEHNKQPIRQPVLCLFTSSPTISSSRHQ